MTPGYKTTEFYVSLLTYLLAILSLFGLHFANADNLVQSVAVVASLVVPGIASIFYTHSRTNLKAAILTHMTTLAITPTTQVAPMDRPLV